MLKQLYNTNSGYTMSYNIKTSCCICMSQRGICYEFSGKNYDFDGANSNEKIMFQQ